MSATVAHAEEAPAAGYRRGRPRSERCEQAIIEATLALLAEVGPADLSVEAVAARAGVGKASIYRRWAGKTNLVADALTHLSERAPRARQTGVLRDDLLALVDLTRRRLGAAAPSARILPRLVGAADPEVLALYHERVAAPRRAALQAVLERGVAVGELPADCDVELAGDLLMGPLVARRLLHPDARMSRDWVERIVDTVLAGLRAI